MYTSTVLSSSSSANAALPPHPHLQTSYPRRPTLHFLPLFPPPSSLAPGCPSTPPASSFPLTLSGFFNGMLEVFEPGALNYFTFPSPILSTLSVSRNPILTPLPLSEFLDSLLCVLIAPTPGLAFSLLMPRTLAAVSSFSSDKAYSFLNSLPPLFLRSIPTLINYLEVIISLNNSSSLSFLNVYAPPIRSSPTDGRTDSLSPSILPSSKNLFILRDFNFHHPLWDSRGTSDPVGRKYSTGSSPLTSFSSMALTHPPFSIAPLAVAPLPTSPLLPPLLPFFAPGRCYRTWVLTTYQFFYLSLSPRSFAPTSVPLPSIFRKLAGMALPLILILTVLHQRNTRLFPLLLHSLPVWH